MLDRCGDESSQLIQAKRYATQLFLTVGVHRQERSDVGLACWRKLLRADLEEYVTRGSVPPHYMRDFIDREVDLNLSTHGRQRGCDQMAAPNAWVCKLFVSGIRSLVA